MYLLRAVSHYLTSCKPWSPCLHLLLNVTMLSIEHFCNCFTSVYLDNFLRTQFNFAFARVNEINKVKVVAVKFMQSWFIKEAWFIHVAAQEIV